jgi:hypothetical protein
MVPEGEANSPAFSVPSTKGMLIEFPVFLRGTPQQASFLFIEQASYQYKPVCLIFLRLTIIQGPFRHRRILPAQAFL